MIEHIRVPTRPGTFEGRAAGPADGRGVLLLHGFPETSAEWEHQLHALATAGYRAVAPDQRGYSPGVRPAEVADYQMRELVGDVLALADALGWDRFDLVGHDWGAAVAWVTAASVPERVRTLTAVSVPHPAAFAATLADDEDQRRRSAYMQFYQQEGTPEQQLLAADAAELRRLYEGKVPAAHVEEYVRRLSEPGALTAALNWYRAMKYRGSVGPVTVPTLYVWSTGDWALGRRVAEASAAYVKGPYRFEVLQDVSHWIPEEAPDTLSRLLLDHLGRYGV